MSQEFYVGEFFALLFASLCTCSALVLIQMTVQLGRGGPAFPLMNVVQFVLHIVIDLAAFHRYPNYLEILGSLFGIAALVMISQGPEILTAIKNRKKGGEDEEDMEHVGGTITEE